MLNESVIKVLKNGMWDLATCADGEPNVVPVAFKDVTDDGKLVVGDVFLETTLNNIKANGGKIAISAYDAEKIQRCWPRSIMYLSVRIIREKELPEKCWNI